MKAVQRTIPPKRIVIEKKYERKKYDATHGTRKISFIEFSDITNQLRKNIKQNILKYKNCTC